MFGIHFYLSIQCTEFSMANWSLAMHSHAHKNCSQLGMSGAGDRHVQLRLLRCTKEEDAFGLFVGNERLADRELAFPRATYACLIWIIP